MTDNNRRASRREREGAKRIELFFYLKLENSPQNQATATEKRRGKRDERCGGKGRGNRKSLTALKWTVETVHVFNFYFWGGALPGRGETPMQITQSIRQREREGKRKFQCTKRKKKNKNSKKSQLISHVLPWLASWDIFACFFRLCCFSGGSVRWARPLPPSSSIFSRALYTATKNQIAASFFLCSSSILLSGRRGSHPSTPRPLLCMYTDARLPHPRSPPPALLIKLNITNLMIGRIRSVHFSSLYSFSLFLTWGQKRQSRGGGRKKGKSVCGIKMYSIVLWCRHFFPPPFVPPLPISPYPFQPNHPTLKGQRGAGKGKGKMRRFCCCGFVVLVFGVGCGSEVVPEAHRLHRQERGREHALVW